VSAFTVDRCSVVPPKVEPPKVEPGQWVAYYTEVGGGAGRGRWIRCLVLRMHEPVPFNPARYVVAIDEENEPVILEHWERVYQPPKLTPKVLRSWFRAMAYYGTGAGPLS
jgi:hypothetical protein